MRKLAMISIPMLLLLGSTACYDPHAQGSKIVREVEAAGSGDLSSFTPQGLRLWFKNHPQMAIKINAECQPLYANAQANWITSAEGSVCNAARWSTPMFPGLTGQPHKPW